MSQSYTTSISYQQKTTNGKSIFIFNGKQYSTMNEMMKSIQNEYPNIFFQTSAIKNNNQSISKQFVDNNESCKSSKFDISRYKGTNVFSNRIFDSIWFDYDYNSDSSNNFIDMKKRFLKESNEYRKAHGAPQLEEDSYLASKAQSYAEYLSKINTLKHDPKNREDNFGENLGSASISIGHLIVKQWYDEIDKYDFDRGNFTPGTGHFTQLIWKKTLKVGFGVIEKNGNIFVVCKYSPPGNYIGDFKENVLKRQI